MIRTFHKTRPIVAFDVGNAEHRKHYADFLRSSSWGQCPVRFFVSDETGNDLPTQIQKSLLEHYIRQEFGISVDRIIDR